MPESNIGGRVLSDDDLNKGVAELAVKQGLVSKVQMEEAIRAHGTIISLGMNKRLSDVLIDKGLINEDQAEVLRHTVESGGEVKIIAGYELLGKLGEGGMGAVYKARQLSLDRLVALKILPERLNRNKEFIARFQREARIAAKLDHPNIIRALDVGEAAGMRYFAMEFVEGEDIGSKLDRDGKMAESLALRLIIQAARALQHAHENHLIHRDIKPDNILVTKDGIAKVADLGLARSTTEDATRMTVTGTAMGTPHYISPEQARGDKDLDIRTDIYSLGVTLYHMLAGQPPFEGSSPAIVITRRLTEEPPSLRSGAPWVFEGTALVVRKMMAKEPADRYTTPADLITDLELVAEHKMPLVAGGTPAADGTLLWAPDTVEVKAVTAPQGATMATLPPAAAQSNVGRETAITSITSPAKKLSGAVLAGIVAVVAVVALGAFAAIYYGGEGERKAEEQANQLLIEVADLVEKGERPKAIARLDARIPVFEGKPVQARLMKRLAELKEEQRLADQKAERERAAAAMLDVIRTLKGAGSFAQALAKAREAKGRYDDTAAGEEINRVADDIEKEFLALEQVRARIETVVALENEGALAAALKKANEAVTELAAAGHPERILKPLVDAAARIKAKLPHEPTPDELAAAALAHLRELVAASKVKDAVREGAEAEKNFAGTASGPAIASLVAGARKALAEMERKDALARALSEARKLEADGSLAAARDAYQRALGLAVENERAPILTALEHIAKLSQYKAAMAEAHAHVAAEHWNEAEAAAKKAIEARPEDSVALALLARIREAIEAARVASARIEEPPAKTRPAQPAPASYERTTNSLGLVFVLVPAGKYTVGSDIGQPDEAPAHEVELDAFGIGVYEVTNAQYEQFDPAHKQARSKASPGDDYPAAEVSWEDAMRFCAWLSRREGATYRLPTEAEWEAAARGTAGRTYPWGDAEASAGEVYRANWGQGKDYSVWRRDGYLNAAPVGSYPEGASPVGCMDMAGNVWEWCLDWYGPTYYAEGPASNPHGPEEGRERCLRGGSWYHNIELARSSNRHKAEPTRRHGSIGFRLVREQPTPE